MTTKKLFVGGLSWDTTQESLEAYFGRYGQIVDCTLKTDPNTGRSRGFGFVEFATDSSATQVLGQSSHSLDGRYIDPKPATGPRGGAGGGRGRGGGGRGGGGFGNDSGGGGYAGNRSSSGYAGNNYGDYNQSSRSSDGGGYGGGSYGGSGGYSNRGGGGGGGGGWGDQGGYNRSYQQPY